MISVVIPIYNVEKYISGCINSIINQSVKDFEVILVDDGSPDQSAKMAEKMLSESWIENFQIIHTENRGVSAARNTGIQSAVGEFVIMIDADDVISPYFLEDMQRMLKQNPDCDIYSAGFSVVDENNADCFNDCGKDVIMSKYTTDESVSLFLSRKVKFLLPTLMLRKNYLAENQICFDENVRYSEDVQFIWRCLFYNKKNVIHLNKENYNYILHGNSTMTASGIDKILTGFKGLDSLHDEVKETVDNGIMEVVVSQMCFSLLHGAAKMLTFKDFSVLYERSGSRKKLKKVKESDYRYKYVVAIMRKNLRMGYYIMRFL